MDPVRRSVSNVQVLVQSKAKAGRLPAETESSFH